MSFFPLPYELSAGWKNTKGILDVHLMVTNPEKWIKDMADAGTDIFTFHVEVTDNQEQLRSMIEEVKATGMKVGLAIKPGTPVESVFPFLEVLDQVLVMTVEPGFGGQKFMKDMMTKVSSNNSSTTTAAANYYPIFLQSLVLDS